MRARAIDVHGSFDEAAIDFAGAALIAVPGGALLWPDQQTLLVADLHLEKGSTHARHGVLLPPHDSIATLARLLRLVQRHRPRCIVALGDSFHDKGGPQRLLPRARALLRELQHGRDWLWVTGNHDPEIGQEVGGTVEAALDWSGITLCHDPTNTGQSGAAIAGHLHPVARLARRGTMVRRPCFYATGHRLVLPAFGAYTGGLNILDPAFATLGAAASRRVWMCGRDGIYPVPPPALRPDG